ncbi:MAG TPA: DUF333 domain-containing protein [Egicoccus sp.]|nr:DUF333 domain-containing protein [Egicoccus sp.]HSK23170.1 DUF333 domain-containing protein [Egicoccus sp.]
MRRPLVASLLAVVLVLPAACGGADDADEPQAEVPNPASVYCEEQGGQLELREQVGGSTAGICVFDDGSECEEWAFLRGECRPGGDDDEPVTPETETVTVAVFLTNSELGDPCGEVFEVERSVAADDAVAGALAALLAGPTDAERQAGYGGWFGPETAGVLRSVVIDGVTARVDFVDLREIIPNASSSCGSAGLLAQLDRTLRQFPDIEQTVYAIEGSASTFYEWLQLAPPEPS